MMAPLDYPWLAHNVNTLAIEAKSVSRQTLQMEQHVRLVIFEHLRHKFHVHVLNVDLLYLIECASVMTTEWVVGFKPVDSYLRPLPLH